MESTSNTKETSITSSLEDYIESIYLLTQKFGYARVKEISQARNVTAPTVTVALIKLEKLGLIQYEKREYIRLTKKGEERGRKIFSRHKILDKFFQEILMMPANKAEEQACIMEHGLSDETMNRLVGFFEFLNICSNLNKTIISCPNYSTYVEQKKNKAVSCKGCTSKETKIKNLTEILPGQKALVVKLETLGELRQRLLDMGILPGMEIEVERYAMGGDPMWIICQGAHLAIRKKEAQTIIVRNEN